MANKQLTMMTFVLLGLTQVGTITQGKAVSHFEHELSLALSSKYTICCNSGTAAIHPYKALEVEPGDSVMFQR